MGLIVYRHTDKVGETYPLSPPFSIYDTKKMKRVATIVSILAGGLEGYVIDNLVDDNKYVAQNVFLAPSALYGGLNLFVDNLSNCGLPTVVNGLPFPNFSLFRDQERNCFHLLIDNTFVIKITMDKTLLYKIAGQELMEYVVNSSKGTGLALRFGLTAYTDSSMRFFFDYGLDHTPSFEFNRKTNKFYKLPFYEELSYDSDMTYLTQGLLSGSIVPVHSVKNNSIWEV